ncbi:hypothetical protein PXK00_07605 [Phaeobacter sp. QD34_3]|uniref:hypothetical protein n=1 Tax=unclassified Phaeobacter TaxID=2621772 RepID=UPI00237F3173|nr:MULTISPECIES: hypothetical protein [unclassified Phaeobacter]MDE4132971.1 hypothetical protein [Phaeobacter sp. QD34_3]MDE4136627.1 hypothetical protein [Phaeobacter sp. QD34_24]MDE4174187.1 hypothetical protein [Phaeobacter sp. PT47_59]
MQVAVSVLPHLDLAYIQYRGRFAVADLPRVAEAVNKIEGYSDMGATFDDMSLVTDMDIGFADLSNVARLTSERLWAQGRVLRSAIWAPTDLSFGLARMYQMASAMRGNLEVEVSADQASCLAWLGLDFISIDELLNGARVVVLPEQA